MTVMEFLERALQPKYVGWQDQYKAILTALDIPLDTDISDLRILLSMLKEE